VVDQPRWGDCPCCGHEVIRGNRGYECSAWKEGCKFVLWPTYKGYELDEGEIRQLLQHGALQQSIELAGVGRVILSMSDSGAVTDIPVPEMEPRRGKVKRKRADRSRTTERLAGCVAEEPDVAPSGGFGNCPLCGADVREQRASSSCGDWKQGCKFRTPDLAGN
jgi:DNA topoisomerase-3